MTHIKFRALPLVLSGALWAVTAAAWAQADLTALEEQAIKDAARRVEPSVVRIETLGKIDQVADLQTGSGPTTGLIITADGYIVASAFDFATAPESILVTIPNRGRTGATLVATDHSRKLVLLKVAAEEPLPVPEAVPANQVRIGQWAIAVGRAYEDDRANVSIGLISAKDRIWSKCYQTDAKISPSNYGGPLVDISGRVLGVLCSLGPDMFQGGGAELYDSGIGFAVPLDHILNILPRWQKGDLKPGILGINLKGNDLFSAPVEIAAARVGSPAYAAGLRAGDTIVEAGGKPITRQAQFKHQAGPLYAGDRLTVAAVRGENKERIEATVELVDTLAPYEFPFAGILPVRPVSGKPEGLVVRFVFPGSAAEAAGLEAGDQITSFGGKEINSAQDFAEKLQEFVPENSVELEYRRGDAPQKVTLVLGRIAEGAPDALPPAYQAERPEAAEAPPRGIVPLKIAEFPNEAFAYVPETYRAGIPHGVVVWFSSPADWNQDDIVHRWKPLCEKLDLILIAPKPTDKAQWQPAEARFARRVLDEVMRSYEVDARRVVSHGHEGGGALALLLALGNQDVVRGVAVVDATLPAGAAPPETNPVQRLLVWSAQASKGPFAAGAAGTTRKLSDLKYPLTHLDTGDKPRYLSTQELNQLARWIDSVDRL